MSDRRPIKEILLDNKLSVVLGIIIIAISGSIAGYFIVDYINAQNPERITLATTTSTYDSGLLDFLLPKFTEATGIYVTVISEGTGAAIADGKAGNADVILVHSRSREDDYVNASLGVNGIPYGIHRSCVMYNDFIIVGHQNNPAQLAEGDNITTVMTKLKNGMEAGNTTFYSRGDNSGTHTKELALWANISWDPISVGTEFYVDVGDGMAAVLLRVYEDTNDRGYTLIDRGTWLSYNDTYTTLNILGKSVEGEDILLNPYGVIPTNPVLYPHVKFLAVCRFVGFLTSPYGQALINSYTKNGEVLFFPDFDNCDNATSCTTTETEVAIWTDFHAEYADEYAAYIA